MLGTTSMQLSKMEKILRDDFGVKAGSKVFVTSAFGSLNANFSPEQLVDLLMRIVTQDGLILMPFYPPGSSSEWADSNSVFDMQKTKSSVGIVSDIFSHKEGVIKSFHPTKAVVGWGKYAAEILANHEIAQTPFSIDSPYGKFLMLEDSVSIGLGTCKFPMGHSIEDIVSGMLIHYRKEKSRLLVRNGENIMVVDTFIHDENRNQIPPSDYIKKCDALVKIKVGSGCCFAISNAAALQFYKEQYSTNPSIW